jgi:Development and cell death domain
MDIVSMLTQMPAQPAGYIFRCTPATEKECFDKMLFGETEKYGSIIEMIKPGDALFLYNNTTQNLFGVFYADSPGARLIDATAWGGKFPWQVKVRWRRQFHRPLPREISRDALSFWGKTKRHPSEKLTLNQVHALKALFEANEKFPLHEENFRKRYPAHFLTQDGHWVRSYAELVIDDWLFHHRIPHGYERKLPVPEPVCSDFHVPMEVAGKYIYIEYWGMIDADYTNRRMEKEGIYKKYNFPLISLERNDLNHIDDVLPHRLKKFLPEIRFY